MVANVSAFVTPGIILLPIFFSTQKSAHFSSIFLISFEVLFFSKFYQKILSRPTNTTVHLIRLSLVQQKCLHKFKIFVPVLYTVRTCHSVHVYRSKKLKKCSVCTCERIKPSMATHARLLAFYCMVGLVYSL